MAKEKRAIFRKLLAGGPMIVAPGAADVLAARFIEAAGFSAVYMSGSLQHKMSGYPDVNVLTMSEMAETAARVANALCVPAIADGETGFGVGVNVTRTIQEYERAGVAAIHIEDSTVPKRPALLGFDSPTVSTPEFVDKIKRALDARLDASLVIIARSELTGDFNRKSDRLQQAVESGADAFWFSTSDEAEMKTLNDRLKRPGVGVLPGDMTTAEYERRGARMGVLPAAMAIAALTAQRGMLAALKESGTPQAWFAAQPDFKAGAAFYQKLGMDKL